MTLKTNLSRGGLLGRQAPRVSSLPSADGVCTAVDFSFGDRALDLAEIAGRESLEWQQYVVRNGTARNAAGGWAAYEVGVLVSRQNGKNGAIEVVELGWMLSEPGVSILHTAHEFQTALESMDKLEELIRSNPKTERLIAPRGVKRGNGKESIRFTNGSIIRFRTRTKSGGRGFSVDRLVIDEAMIWSPASQAAILPLLTTAERPQIWYLGSAADVETHEHCGKWASLRKRALSGEDPALCWMEWSAPEPPKSLGRDADAAADALARAAWREDRENWAAANPSLGYLLTEEYIEAELAAFADNLEKWEVERLSAGRWPSVGSSRPSVIDPEVWSRMVNPVPSLVGPVALAVDRSANGRHWAIAAAQRTTDGRIHLEVEWQQGSHDDIVTYLLRAVKAWDPVAIAIDRKSGAAVLEAHLVRGGVEPEMTGAPQMAVACQGFYDDAVGQLLSHVDDHILNDALSAAQKRVMPQGDWAWDRSGDAAISPLVAATLARWALIQFAVEKKPTGPPAYDTAASDSSELDVFEAAF